jgi:hypothetical protein
MILIGTGEKNLKVTKLYFLRLAKEMTWEWGSESQQEKRTWFHRLIKGLKVYDGRLHMFKRARRSFKYLHNLVETDTDNEVS